VVMTSSKRSIDPEHRYTRKEVASILNVSYASVMRMVERGDFPEESHLRVKRILGKDLRRYLRDVRREAKANFRFDGSQHLRMQRFEEPA
jgi:hypothetical protein